VSGHPDAQVLELVLYVNAHALSSRRARDTVERVLRGFAADQVRLVVRDVAQEPLAAEKDGVLFAPTLVKTHPPPRAWLVGDLAEGAAVTALLHATGMEELDEP
jgi:hypothetical protein